MNKLQESKEYADKYIIKLPSVGSALDKNTQLIHPLFESGVIDFSVSVKVEECTDEFFEKLEALDLIKFNDNNKLLKCSICKEYIDIIRNADDEVVWESGHNAQPINDGRCCTSCNNNHVISSRLALFNTGTLKNDVDYLINSYKEEAKIIKKCFKERNYKGMNNQVIRLGVYATLVNKLRDDMLKAITEKAEVK